MQKLLALLAILYSSFLTAEPANNSPTLDVTFELPALQVNPYHRPYVAIWLETPKRQGVTTLAVWYEKDDWLKDLRQWWRKLGRSNRTDYDAVSGATRKPGRYTLTWHGLDHQQQPIATGEYFLNIEAAREAGGRDFIRQKITWSDTPQSFALTGKGELGNITINIR